MASFKVMPTSSTPSQSNLNSDLSSLQFHHHNLHRSFSSSSPSMMISPPHQQPTPLLDTAEITLIDASGAISAVGCDGGGSEEPLIRKRTVDDVWREIMLTKDERKECKVETPDELITLEDFLAKTGAGIDGGDDEDDGDNEEDVKGGYDHHQVSYSALNVVDCGGGGGGGGGEVVGGRRKRRGGSIFEPLDKAAQQRQRRMIKNRESAARSRERKQAYQVELESLAAKLQEENAQLQREKVERAKERYRQIIEKVIPVVEKRRPPRVLRRVQST